MAKFKIGELSKLLNIPETTIRYYDKMGIVDSHKNNHSGYRVFNEVDMHNLMHYKLYRSYGLNQKQAQQCIYDLNLDEIDQVLSEDEQDIARQIRFLTEKQRIVQAKRQFIEALDHQLGTLQVIERKACCLIGYRQRNGGQTALIQKKENYDILSDWMERFPLVSMTPYFLESDFRSQLEQEYSGLIVEKKIAEEFNLICDERVMELPPARCISYVFHRQKAMTVPFIRYMEPVFQYLDEHQYEVCGTVTFDHYIALKKHSEHLFYGRVLVPFRSINTPASTL
ncbi:MerR family transcriptional regulator [Holdemania massiliensis]|uniref:MerR family transcriptional regulator n=1 Tax=Holdemania massiliensis TaxID=1468449 RepID=UPI001F054119|nr:MerR family transcriptional regulator [Holdemania massiliensis]MCH1942255.1 MerR family transcriptional regulator [Holdemania massiliensis]